jgi:hypothetical protein
VKASMLRTALARMRRRAGCGVRPQRTASARGCSPARTRLRHRRYLAHMAAAACVAWARSCASRACRCRRGSPRQMRKSPTPAPRPARLRVHAARRRHGGA